MAVIFQIMRVILWMMKATWTVMGATTSENMYERKLYDLGHFFSDPGPSQIYSRVLT